MVQLQAIVLLVMKPLFWMETNASVMMLIILIRLTQRIVTKAFAKNVLIIMEIAMDYKLFVFNVTLNGNFSFFLVVVVIIEIILALMNAFVKQDIIILKLYFM